MTRSGYTSALSRAPSGTGDLVVMGNAADPNDPRVRKLLEGVRSHATLRSAIPAQRVNLPERGDQSFRLFMRSMTKRYCSPTSPRPL
jgi:hypothetical protein